MWTKPWSMREGFLIGGAVVVVGLMLELSIGPVVWNAFAWPVNGIALAGFLALISAFFLLRNKVYAFRFMGTLRSAIPVLVYAVALTVVMGLTQQEKEGTWLHGMLSFWPFVLVYAYMALILGLVVVKRTGRLLRHFSIADCSFLLNHAGLLIALTTATVGNADMERLRMIAVVGEPEWRAMTDKGFMKELPLTIELKSFIMETYDDGSPRRFASELEITTKKGKSLSATVDVNKPIEVEGWKIYQYGYDPQAGSMSQMSILELVRDPWLPAVYTGIYMMLGGALCMFVFGRRRKKQ